MKIIGMITSQQLSVCRLQEERDDRNESAFPTLKYDGSQEEVCLP